MRGHTVPPPAQKYVTAVELAAMTGINASAWSTWRKMGTGPAFYRIHGRCYYDKAEVLAWIERRRSERRFSP